jgi:DNA-binding PadR family transcriptional regulator
MYCLTIYRRGMKRAINLLPQISFSILLALSLRPRHGYEIIKQVHQDSLGKINMVPGTLYGAIKQLLEQKMIHEIPRPKGERRRYYQLTDKGRQQLESEIDYFNETVVLAKQRLTHAILIGKAVA